jgi:hypothetical protein
MDATEEARFHVLLARGEGRDPMALARVLAGMRGTPVHDQVLAAKRSWGIVGEDLSEAQAREMAKELRGAQMECLVCSRSALVALPEAEPARKIGDFVATPPAVIAAAGVTVTSKSTRKVNEGPSPAQKAVSTAIMLSTGLPLKIGGKKRAVQKTETQQDLVFCVDLLYEDPPRRQRIVASEFDYSFLGARKLYQALGNCKLLLGELVSKAPQAWQNHGTRILTQSQPVNLMGYGSFDDLEREERWLLTLRALGV